MLQKKREKMIKEKNFIIEICPSLIKDWNKNKIFNKTVEITKTEVNFVTNKLAIFCNKNHNCFCDKRVRENPHITKVVRGKEIK